MSGRLEPLDEEHALLEVESQRSLTATSQTSLGRLLRGLSYFLRRLTGRRLFSLLLLSTFLFILTHRSELRSTYANIPFPDSYSFSFPYPFYGSPTSNSAELRPLDIWNRTQVAEAFDSIFWNKDAEFLRSNPWVGWNQRKLDNLVNCLLEGSCATNQGSIVILASSRFSGAYNGGNSGKEMWARSTMIALENLGFTYVFADSIPTALRIYQAFPHNTRAVLMSSPQIETCFPSDAHSLQTAETCVKTKHFRSGIPPWKIFAFYFWEESKHPLGPRWTLSAEPFGGLPGVKHLDDDGVVRTLPRSNNTYLGYSVQPSCMRHAILPLSIRPEKAFQFFMGSKGFGSFIDNQINTGFYIDGASTDQKTIPQAYILAKHITYFAPGPDKAWPLHSYEEISRKAGVRLVGGVGMNMVGLSDHGVDGQGMTFDFDVENVPKKLPGSIYNLLAKEEEEEEEEEMDEEEDEDEEGEEGKRRKKKVPGVLDQSVFLDILSRSSVLIGVGKPTSSPTPYEALCLGVPFINPILSWDEQNPTDRTAWRTQHEFLTDFDPPHVYHVFKNDINGLVGAVKAAVSTPIKRFITKGMEMEAVEHRLLNILQTDWKSEAGAILKAGHDEQTFEL